MSVSPTLHTMSVDEYLRIEKTASTRHEFLNGHVFAMVGSSQAHNTIALTMASILRAHIRGSGCRTYISDMKVRIEATNTFYYPDVVVSCEPFDGASLFIKAPVLIVEILSPSTATIDHREKLAAYTQIESLQEYLIVYQDKRQIKRHSKDAGKNWTTLTVVAEEELELNSLPNGELKISIETIYEGID